MVWLRNIEAYSRNTETWKVASPRGEMKWGRLGKDRAVSQMTSGPTHHPLDLHLSCTCWWLASASSYNSSPKSSLQLEGKGVPHSPWTSEKQWVGIGRQIFQLLYPLGGSTLRCALYHPPGLPGEIKPHSVATLPCSLMLPQLASFPSLSFLGITFQWNHLHSNLYFRLCCLCSLTQAIFQHELFRTISIWFLQQCTCIT